MEKENELLFFEPVFVERIWGGKKLRDCFNYDIPSDHVGECWGISAHENGDCVVKNGKFKGKSLSYLYENERKLFGNVTSSVFPLLIKVIDTKEDCSIQVHPDDAYAKEHENGSLGKMECWYILDCEKDSKLIVGHKAKTKEELCKLIDEGKLHELLREVPVKKGDFVQVDPGTVHAITGGVMVLETQQSSDITYRVYDYDRLFNGKKRSLHLKECKDVITVPSDDVSVKHFDDVCGAQRMIDCSKYSVDKITVKEDVDISVTDSFRLFSCVEGKGSANGVKVKKGDHFMAPAGLGIINLKGEMILISSIAK